MTLTFSPGMYSDPSLRPHLEKYYTQQYAPFRERIEGMKAAEASGEAPQTIVGPNGEVATELSAAQYEAAIPSFDKWLEMQADMSTRFENFTEQSLASAQTMLAHFESHTPDASSQVRTVFASGSQILGYVNADGSVVTHNGGQVLQSLAEEADRLNLSGEAKIDYITRRGKQALSAYYGDVSAHTYTPDNMPTRREFAHAWYPHHDVDKAYMEGLANARDMVAQAQERHQNMLEVRREMLNFLMVSLEEGM